ncbi:hypothetical protein GCM10008949_31250 [Deinococcus humi]|nr:hypothetical protein GCM10008949_31250 [Deinococcus humi]
MWAAILTCICAGGGLILNDRMVDDPNAFILALLMASVAIGTVAWRVWGKETAVGCVSLSRSTSQGLGAEQQPP